jgi:Abnormal spindle-like microcephaly-assoc'd, ASPM-SPD-2-Hydin
VKHQLLSAILLAVISSVPAAGAIVGQTFTGVTSANPFQPSSLNTEFPAGTRWTLRIEWDDAASPIGTFTNQAQYAATKITLTLQGTSGAWTTSSISSNRSFTLNTGSSHEIQFTSGWGPTDHTNQTLLGSVQPYSINLVLGDPTATAITALTPAPKAINLALWSADPTKSYFKFYLNNMGNQYMLGTIDGVGVVTEPEISLRQPANKELKDGKSSISFGSSTVGKATAAKTFTIRNTGKGTLSGLKVSRTGNHKKDFLLGPLSKSSLAPGAKATFTVSFKPKAKGPRVATLKISSNDKDENPFDIEVTGTGK